MFEEYDGEQKQRIQDAVLTYLELTPEIEAVWVSDTDGNEIWASGEMAPDREQINKFHLSEEEPVNLVVEEDLRQILTIEEDKFTKYSKKKEILNNYTTMHYWHVTC